VQRLWDRGGHRTSPLADKQQERSEAFVWTPPDHRLKEAGMTGSRSKPDRNCSGLDQGPTMAPMTTVKWWFYGSI